MKNVKIFGLLAVLVVGALFTTSIASAYRGDYTQKGPDYNEDRHEAMEDAFESLDYDAWYDLMTENGRFPRVVNVVTESNFETFAKAHEAGENGDYEKAAELRAELGLNNGMGPKDGSGYGKSLGNGQGMQQNMDGNRDGSGLSQGRGRK